MLIIDSDPSFPLIYSDLSADISYNSPPQELHKAIPVNEYLNSLIRNFFDNISFNSGFSSVGKDTIINPGLLYCDDNIVIYQKPPSYQNLFFIPLVVESINSSSEEFLYRLPLPWQVYVFTYNFYLDENNIKNYYVNNVYMYFSNTCITSVDQPVYLPPLPNFWTNGMLCRPMHDDIQDTTPFTNDISGLIALSYDWIWNSGTNADLTESIVQGIVQPYTNNQTGIFRNSYYGVSPNSYYLNYPIIDKFFTDWQKEDLDQILFADWPIPSLTKRFIEIINSNYNNHFNTWLQNNYEHTFSDDCCEECQAYDEDGEPLDYCNYGDCGCHSYSTEDIYKFIKDRQIFNKTITLHDVVDNIITEHKNSLIVPSQDITNFYNRVKSYCHYI